MRYHFPVYLGVGLSGYTQERWDINVKKSDISQTFSGKRKIWVENLPARKPPSQVMFEGVPGSVWGLPGVSYEIY